MTETIAPGRCTGSTPPTRPASTRSCSTSTGRPTRASSAPTRSSACRSPAPTRRRRRTTCRCTATSAASARRTLPVPMFNILNGGKHAQDSTDFQEFMVMPVGVGDVRRGAPRRRRGLRGAARRSSTTKGHATGQGDEGGFAPSLPSNEAAVEVILRAIEAAGYRPGEDVAIALDPATTELVERDGRSTAGRPATCWPARAGRSTPASSSTCGPTGSRATRSSRSRTASPRTTGPAGDALTARLGDTVQLVGDDLLVTNTRSDRPRHRGGDARTPS